jgi:hypothetical protein
MFTAMNGPTCPENEGLRVPQFPVRGGEVLILGAILSRVLAVPEQHFLSLF